MGRSDAHLLKWDHALIHQTPQLKPKANNEIGFSFLERRSFQGKKDIFLNYGKEKKTKSKDTINH